MLPATDSVACFFSYLNVSPFFLIASSYPVRAEKGANCAARLSIDICGCLVDT